MVTMLCCFHRESMKMQALLIVDCGRQAAPEVGSTASPGSPLKKTRLATDQLVTALNEHVRSVPPLLPYCCRAHSWSLYLTALQLTERRRGNDYFRKGLLDKAMCQYQRAHTVLDMIEGMGKDDQEEIDINKSVVLLNIAAVQLARQEFAAAADSCSAALKLQPDNIKGLVRRAKCYSNMHEYKVRGNTRQ